MIVDLNLSEKLVIVIGGGTEGVRKVKGLLGQNCNIVLISDEVDPILYDLNQQGKINVIQRKINNAEILNDFSDPFLILAATDNKDLNRKFVEKGRSMGSFVYAADDPPVSDFSYASIINIEGVLQTAISTYGKSPLMARKLRIKVEKILENSITKSDIENTKLQEFARNAARPVIHTVDERKQFLYSILNDHTIQDLISKDKIEEAKHATLNLLNRWESVKK